MGQPEREVRPAHGTPDTLRCSGSLRYGYWWTSFHIKHGIHPASPSMKTNLIAIDYLRAFMTVVVLLIHSSLAYVSFAPSAMHAFTNKPYLWVNYPVMDSQRWMGFDIIFLYGEHFLLGLMFLVAGLFIWPSIARKGRKGYLLGRFKRLGLPLVVVVALCSPLAYYPSYALRANNPAVGAYFEQWLSLDFWSPGPCWFIAVLLIFDVVAVLLHRFLPKLIEGLGWFCSGAEKAPVRFYLGLVGAAAMIYLALCVFYGGTRWLTTPQYEQTSHALLFLVYFFAGMGIGAWGLDRGLLAQNGNLVRRWPAWLGLSACTFVFYAFCAVQVESQGLSPAPAWLAARNAAYVVSGAAASFFLMAAFLRFANRHVPVLNSLSANAYGMYLLHYAFVTWGQYLLTGVALPAFVKGLAVFVFTLAGSWGTVAAMRRVPLLYRRIWAPPKAASAAQL